MSDLTINPMLATKRITNIDNRLKRYPDHPAKEKMLAERERYQTILDQSGKTKPKPNRILNRVDTLVAAIRKTDMMLDANPKHPQKKRLLERRAEYQTSLKNIQKYGREKEPPELVGVQINVPTDVLNQRSE